MPPGNVLPAGSAALKGQTPSFQIYPTEVISNERDLTEIDNQGHAI